MPVSAASQDGPRFENPSTSAGFGGRSVHDQNGASRATFKIFGVDLIVLQQSLFLTRNRETGSSLVFCTPRLTPTGVALASRPTVCHSLVHWCHSTNRGSMALNMPEFSSQPNCSRESTDTGFWMIFCHVCHRGCSRYGISKPGVGHRARKVLAA